jgi:hypothetical protein
VNQKEANVFLDLGLAVGTYLMAELAVQGYPLSPITGQKLKKMSMEDIEKLTGAPAEETLKGLASSLEEIMNFIKKQDETHD